MPGRASVPFRTPGSDRSRLGSVPPVGKWWEMRSLMVCPSGPVAGKEVDAFGRSVSGFNDGSGIAAAVSSTSRGFVHRPVRVRELCLMSVWTVRRLTPAASAFVTSWHRSLWKSKKRPSPRLGGARRVKLSPLFVP
jgi:hypothetical protein